MKRLTTLLSPLRAWPFPTQLGRGGGVPAPGRVAAVRPASARYPGIAALLWLLCASAAAQPALPAPQGGPAPAGELADARRLFDTRQFDAAERLARRLLVRATAPAEVATAWSLAGLAAGARGDCDGALPALRRALQAPALVAADLPRLELTLARCLRARGRLVPARRHAEAALGHLRGADRSEAFEIVAAGALAKGEEARAAQALARAWREAPPNRQASLRELAGKLGSVNPSDLRLAFETLRPDRFPAGELALKLAEFAALRQTPDEGRAFLAAAALALRADPALQAAADTLHARLAGRVLAPIAEPNSATYPTGANPVTAATGVNPAETGKPSNAPTAAGAGLWPSAPPPLTGPSGPLAPLPAEGPSDPTMAFPPRTTNVAPPTTATAPTHNVALGHSPAVTANTGRLSGGANTSPWSNSQPVASSANPPTDLRASFPAAGPGPATSPMLGQRLKVAVLVGLSGPGKDVGERVLRGAKLALASREGALADGLELWPLDTKGDPAEAARLVAQAAADPSVLAVVGPVLVREATAAAQAAALAQLPLIALSQAERVTAAGPSVFRLFLTPERQARAVALHAVQKLGRKRFAILHPRTPYGQAMRAAFTTLANRLGATVVTSYGYARGTSNFRDAARALRAHEFDALFFPDGYRTVALAASYLVAQGVRIGDPSEGGVRLCGTNEWNADELLRLGGRYLQNAIFPVGYSTQATRSEAQQLYAAHQAAHGGAPTFLEAYAWDALRALRAATARGAVTRAALPAALLGLELPGATGLIRFDGERELSELPQLLRIEGSAFRPVE